MRAYHLSKPGSIDNISLAETDIPKPGRGQVLVRMHAASLNYRDLMIAEARGRTVGVPPDLIPLSDGAGEVVELGAEVTGVAAGDRVAGLFHQSWIGGEVSDRDFRNALGGTINGVLAEYVLFDQSGIVPLPAHLSYEEGSTLPCAAVTAWHALTVGELTTSGHSVLVLGTGGVSVFALQLAHTAGARVIVTSASDSKLDRAKGLGATECVNYKTFPEWQEQVRALTNGRGVDRVIEVGGAETLPRSLTAVRRGGIVSVIGGISGSGDITLSQNMLRGGRIVPISVGSRQHFEAMNRAISHHKLKPVIDKVFPFKETLAAYHHLKSQAHFGKIVIRIE